MTNYHVIGLMSGSSLDGLDIAYCKLTEDKGDWSYKIIKTELVPFDEKWKLRLKELDKQDGITYLKTHTLFGHYTGDLVKTFVEENKIKKLDFIASHGQTIFHQPENRITSQIGDGAAIAAICQVPVVNDFRTADVALGGQGTPIVPIADLHFFKDYAFCLNLGGIGNISYKPNGKKIIAFDNCGSNIMLNALAGQLGAEYDEDGSFAAKGKLDGKLLEELNESLYFQKSYPKSLSAQWVNEIMLPIIDKYKISIEDKLNTVCEHIGIQIAKDIQLIYKREGKKQKDRHKMLVTGGGAFNKYLVERIREHSPLPIELPDNQTIRFKEALLMALMGALRIRNEVNCLASVTGASQDSVGGVIHLVPGQNLN